ncbi:Intramolecular chaperone auto-processing domain containing protein [uncultured Caudovirales phage]|uniref:Intramolecular chaperone auto-processing domain containing protein n=1 Tax=uncultured Caudovirales phage TaxID=2100421 RepID=A0A6J5N2Q0_9CAUD|nr:Intramolecular chaperone auto-processing domain containing protein [uncultured Caudovirales phage]
MANKKINELDSRASLSLSDLLAVGDPTTGYLYKITITDLKSLTGAGVISFNGRVGSVVPAEGDYSLNQLSDVIITTAANGNIVKYNGSNWVNVPMYTGTIAQYVDGTGAYQTFPTLLSSDRLLTEVRNTTGATIAKGTVIYLNGSSGTLPTIAKAQANSEATSSTTYGVVQNDIANNANGYVVVIGNLTGIDTSAYNAGDILWLSPTVAGGYTTTKPSAPNNSVYIGIVTRSNNTAGTIEVKIQNGYELDELHNVAISSVANNQVLVYESSSTLWKNKSIATILGYTPISLSSLSASAPLSYNSGTGAFSISQATTSTDGYLSSTDWNTFNGKQNALTNPITGTGVSGRVAYFNGTTSQTSSANLTWDNTDNRLGIGLTNPQRSLEIYSATADSHLRLSGAAPTVSMGEAVTGAVYQAKFGLVTVNAQFVTGSLAGDFVIISQTGATIWATSGGEKMRLTSGGNLGIGTTAPGKNLEVVSAIRVTSNASTGFGASELQFFAHNGSSVVYGGGIFQTNSTFSYQQISPNQTNIYGSAANGIRIATANAPIIFATGNSDIDLSTARLTISSGGNVLVSTTTSNNAVFKLQVGDGSSDARSLFNSNNPYSIAVGNGASSLWYIGVNAQTASNGLQFYSNDLGSAVMTINTTGNVGIGTTSPGVKLSVFTSGMSFTSSTITYSAGSSQGFLLDNSAGTSQSGNAIWFANSGLYSAISSTRVDTGTWGTDLRFYTHPDAISNQYDVTERMRITSGGLVLIGATTTSSSAELQVFGNNGIRITNAASQYRQIYNSGGDLYFWNGSNQGYLSSGGVWTNASDISIKKDIEDIQYGLNEVLKLKPRYYKMKANDLEQIGFISQEVEQVIKELVSTDNLGMKGLSYGNLTAVLVKAIQEQQEQIEQLKTQIK